MTSDPALSRTLYVGGLDDNVDRAMLQAAFLPFGEIRTVEIPSDNKTGKHRGFGFVEFAEEGDAQDAIDNMHESEFFGRTIRVNLAREPSRKPRENSSKPVWADDFFFRKRMKEQGMEIDENI
mmetsp:Transcript_35181/g.77011  ORF Transcript_35181/g.77011 Transcript_35181/m.77011 type:complete len:123 (-) Transcript_35181:95-463(-)|eukprot:CAMPEP_0204407832 /NCGR_PEP_ID=MMETSP0470-20130426/9025_1 /ASSEMBLY_ACC=CAM_ASM_000385 /TAXON_ID=2969 /ORGANISM="Oxyrrhis marina" /LENGTH=122 /DNA_ID=CAMNT_0051403517 /DNA_START=17 /DNA_END=385 /DNA_ORIENTATION=-